MVLGKNLIEKSVRLRVMQKSDLRQVINLERGAKFDAWGKRYFRSCLRPGFTCRVLMIGDNICGYGIISIDCSKGRIMNLLVSPHHQGQGLGRELLVHLLDKARRSGVENVTLEVRSSNLVAQSLFRSMGFTDSSVLYRYYLTRTGWENAIVMDRVFGHIF